MATGGGELTPNEERFVQEYLLEPNATRAYLRAFTCRTHKPGYGSARAAASRLRANVNISAAIEAGRKDLKRSTRLSAVRVIRSLVASAFFDPADVFEADPVTGYPVPRPWGEVPPAARRSVAGIKVKRRRVSDPKSPTDTVEEVEEVEYRFRSPDPSLDKLCRHLGLTKDGAALEALLALLREERAGTDKTDPAGGKGGGKSRGGDPAEVE